MKDETKLRAFLEALWSQVVQPGPTEEAWRDLIRVPGRNHAITRAIYWYFLEVLPPHFLGCSCFAHCDGRGPLRLFIHRGGQYICRQLTKEETITFCDLAGIKYPD